MSKLTEMMNEISNEESTANLTEVDGVETNKEVETVAAEETPKEVEETIAVKSPNTESEVEPSIETSSQSNPTEKKGHTNEERISYAFKKRLDRQSRKYEDKIAELEKKLEALQNPTKAKTREDFATDEEFVRDYFNGLVNDALTKRDEENNRKKLEEDAQSERMANFANQVEKEFGNLDKYNEVVEASLEMGLAQLIENNPVVKDYIKNSPSSARVLYKLATSQDDVTKVFSCRSEFEQFYALKKIEEATEGQNFLFDAPKAEPTPTPIPTTPTEPIKPIGKVGSESNHTTENWESREWLMKQIRGH